MSRRKLYLIAGLVILIMVLLILLFLRRGAPTGTGEANPQGAQPQAATQGTAAGDNQNRLDVSQLPPSPSVAMPDQSLAAVSVARSFVERYGTFSTQSQYQNRKELFANMTPRLRTQEEAEIARLQQDMVTVPFRGVTTRALVVNNTVIEGVNAQVDLSVQHIEEKDGALPITQIKNVKVVLVNDGDVWLVDGVTWE